jgi:hypothetical protein
MNTSKERPVLFQTPMVQAILKGRKTMTRRARKLGNVGDMLWVRETFAWNPDYIDGIQAIYKADDCHVDMKWKPSIFMPHSQCRLWLKLTDVRQEPLDMISVADIEKEGIYALGMRKTLITLPVFHWKSLKDYWTQGVTLEDCYDCPVLAFSELWDSINGKDSFDKNPLIWVHEFEVLRYYE